MKTVPFRGDAPNLNSSSLDENNIRANVRLIDGKLDSVNGTPLPPTPRSWRRPCPGSWQLARDALHCTARVALGDLHDSSTKFISLLAAPRRSAPGPPGAPAPPPAHHRTTSAVSREPLRSLSAASTPRISSALYTKHSYVAANSKVLSVQKVLTRIYSTRQVLCLVRSRKATLHVEYIRVKTFCTDSTFVP